MTNISLLSLLLLLVPTALLADSLTPFRNAINGINDSVDLAAKVAEERTGYVSALKGVEEEKDLEILNTRFLNITNRIEIILNRLSALPPISDYQKREVEGICARRELELLGLENRPYLVTKKWDPKLQTQFEQKLSVSTKRLNKNNEKFRQYLLVKSSALDKGIAIQNSEITLRGGYVAKLSLVRSMTDEANPPLHWVVTVDYNPYSKDRIHLYNQEMKASGLSEQMTKAELKTKINYDSKADVVEIAMGQKTVKYALPKGVSLVSSDDMWKSLTTNEDQDRGMGETNPNFFGSGQRKESTSLNNGILGEGLDRQDAKIAAALARIRRQASARERTQNELYSDVKKFTWKERNLALNFPDHWQLFEYKGELTDRIKIFLNKENRLGLTLVALPQVKGETMTKTELFNLLAKTGKRMQGTDYKNFKNDSISKMGFEPIEITQTNPVSGKKNYMAGGRALIGNCYYAFVISGGVDETSEVKSCAEDFAKRLKWLEKGKDMSVPSPPPHKMAGGAFEVDLSSMPYQTMTSELPQGFSVERLGMGIHMAVFEVGDLSDTLKQITANYLKVTAMGEIMKEAAPVLTSKQIASGEVVSYKSPSGIPSAIGVQDWNMSAMRNGSRLLVIISSNPKENTHCEKWLESILGQVKKIPISGPIPVPENLEGKIFRARSLNQFGVLAMANGRLSKAIPFFESAITLWNENSILLENLIQSLVDLGRYPDALKALDKYQNPHQKNQRIAMWRASVLANLKRFAEAATLYEKLFEQGLRDTDQLYLFITALQNSEQGQRAVDVSKTLWKETKSPVWRRVLVNTLWTNGSYEEAINHCKMLVQESPGDESLVGDYIELHIEFKKFKAALKLASEWDKYDGKDSARISFLKGLAESNLGWYKASLASHQKALRLAPENATVKQSIAQIEGMLGQGSRQGIVTDLKMVAIPDDVQKAAKKAAATKDSKKEFIQHGSGFIRDMRVYRWTRGSEATVSRYQTIELAGPAGLNQFSTITIPFHPLQQVVCVNKMNIIDKDGKILGAYRPEEAYVIDENSNLATGRKVLQIPVAGLKVGAVIDLVYTIKELGTKESFPMVRQVMKHITNPCIYRSVVISGDTQNLSWKLQGDVELRKKKGQIVFEAFHTTPTKVGNWLPDWDQWLPYVVASSKDGNWSDIATDYLKEVDSIISDQSGAKMMVEELKLKGKTDQEIIRAVASWISKNFQYQGLEFGRRARIPSVAQKTMLRRHGDCKDLSVLSKSILEMAGVRAHLALVSSNGGILEEIASLDQFDHMIVYLPDVLGGVFYDPTAKNLVEPGAMPSSLVGAKVLILEPKNPRFHTIEEPKTVTRKVTMHRSIRLDEAQKQLVVTEKLTADTVAGSYLRSIFTSTPPAQHSMLVSKILQSSGATVQVEKVDVIDLEELSMPLRITMTYRTTKGVEILPSEVTIKIPSLWERFMLQIEKETTRESPVQVRTANTLETHVDFTLPKGYHLQDGKNVKLEEAKKYLIGRQGNVDLKGQLWSLNYTVNLFKGRLPADQYDKMCIERQITLDATEPILRLHK